MNLIGMGLYFGGIFGSIVSLKFLLINNLRIPESITKLCYNKVIESDFNFIIEQEFTLNDETPMIYKSLCKFGGKFVLFDKMERLFTAGYVAKENLTNIYFFRWNSKKIKDFLVEINNVDNEVGVFAFAPYFTKRIGSLSCKDYSVVLDDYIYKDIEADVARVINGEIYKTGALLYGSPGNGKSMFVKYIAQKYSLPIYTFYFSPDYTNLDILEAFSYIPKRCIILFEDFDNYFNDRECLMKSESVKFTFDILLNCLDGVYNDYKQNVFFMTVNDLDKVSDALKKRPSRFKYVREFKNPSIELKGRLFGDKELAETIGNISLDETFKLKDYISTNGVIQLHEAKNLLK
jgi:hypothetical protein